MSEIKTNEYQPRRQYDEDYKRRAVELTLQGKRTVRQVAKELGVTESLLYDWRHRFAPRPGADTGAPERAIKIVGHPLRSARERFA